MVGRAYHVTFLPRVLRDNPLICHLEALSATLAIKLWAPQFVHQLLHLFCNNQATVTIFQAGQGKDAFLQACARDIWQTCAQGTLPSQSATCRVPTSKILPTPSADTTWAQLIKTGSLLSSQIRASPSTQSQIICSPYLMMSNPFPEYMLLPQLQKVMQHLAAHAFHPGTSRNHTLQAESFIQFCDHYHLRFLNPDISTVCLYITHLTCHFSSGHSICNYVSRVRTLHKEIGLTPVTLESFQVSCLLWAADISM